VKIRYSCSYLKRSGAEVPEVQ